MMPREASRDRCSFLSVGTPTVTPVMLMEVR